MVRKTKHEIPTSAAIADKEHAARNERKKRDGTLFAGGLGLLALGAKALFPGHSPIHEPPKRSEIPGIIVEQAEKPHFSAERQKMYQKFANSETTLTIAYGDGGGAQTVRSKGLPYVWNREPGNRESGIDEDRKFVQIEAVVQNDDGSYERRLFHLATTAEPQLTDSDGRPMDGTELPPSLLIEVAGVDSDALRGTFEFGPGGFKEDLTAFGG